MWIPPRKPKGFKEEDKHSFQPMLFAMNFVEYSCSKCFKRTRDPWKLLYDRCRGNDIKKAREELDELLAKEKQNEKD